jgi:hypothetical protein
VRALRPALLLLAAACGGNFSNDDVEFLNALPVREELRAKLPEAPATAAAPGERTLGALALGQRSKLYDDTRRGSQEYNTGLDNLLTLVEFIRRQPPTERDPDARRWGPFPAEDQPGFEARFRMAREAERFTYFLEFRPRGTGEEAWFAFLSGDFAAAFGVRKGVGHLLLDVAAARARGLRVDNLATLERLEVEYETQALPSRVHMLFVPAAERLDGVRLEYTYRELPGGSGSITFLLLGTQSIGGPLSAPEDLAITSRWTPDAGGRGTVAILAGDFAGATTEECWDAGAVTRYERNALGLVTGEPGACPDTSALGP